MSLIDQLKSSGVLNPALFTKKGALIAAAVLLVLLLTCGIMAYTLFPPEYIRWW